LRVSNRDAAAMFPMNVSNWKDRPFIRETYDRDAIQALEAELQEIAAAPGKDSAITWALRQIVFERRAGG
jgi:hypothetical protein